MLDSEKPAENQSVIKVDGNAIRDRRDEYPRPSSGEAPFHLHEVFFSRTDDRGVIKSGNYVFHRVPDYSWEDLIGAPHKIIRHPDMPKGVFWLFWDTLKKGEAIGAYVKNRARDGLYYWVFAAAVPCEDGYLSARIKPSSPVFDTIRKEYDALLRAEKNEGLSAEESGKRLLARLDQLGFESYKHFESHALSEELLSRNTGLKKPADEKIVLYRSMLELATELKATTSTLVSEFEAVRIIPHNMRVIASRLEPTGGPFSTLSGNYGAMSGEISEWFESHVVGEDSDFSKISDTVNFSMFLEGISSILRECETQLLSERRQLGSMEIEDERLVLTTIANDYSARSADSLRMIHDETRRIRMACGTMSRHVLGLSTTRVMCKIESARMGTSGEGLAEIIGQLGRFQEKIGGQLEAIAKLSEKIENLSGTD